MKIHCQFCHERYSDENLHSCHICGSNYCFEANCDSEHEAKCEQLANREETFPLSFTGVYSFWEESPQLYAEIANGHHFHCPNCEQLIAAKVLRLSSWLTSCREHFVLKRLVTKRGKFYTSRKYGNLLLGSCRFCGAWLEIQGGTGATLFTVAPRWWCPFAQASRKDRIRYRTQIRHTSYRSDSPM